MHLNTLRNARHGMHTNTGMQHAFVLHLTLASIPVYHTNT
jgi:hypothetical protein